ncbi:MAG: FAD-dependent oxidoreductase [Lentisphaeria bacterium]|nr:FAD-dependent oxidoreductase [Lentisphaeria bacterium]
MVNLTIDTLSTEAAPGETVLSVAKGLGIDIPTLCHDSRLPHVNACMVCLVRDIKADRMIPACSYPVEDGMEIDASSAAVRHARRDALELLSREHFGDCEAPCRRGCPGGLDISAMMKAVAAGDWQAAGNVVRDRIPIPMMLGEICPAPCEKTCRRKAVDTALRIREIKGAVGWFAPVVEGAPADHSGRHVAVIGAGPAGVSAAYFLRRKGYGVTVYEREARPWDALTGKLGGSLNPETARLEYDHLKQAGVSFVCGRDIRARDDLSALLDGHAAIVLAGGHDMRTILESMAVEILKDGRMTSVAGVFACGSLREDCGKMAVRAVAAAQDAAAAVDAFIKGDTRPAAARRFDSRAGTLTERQVMSLAENALRGGPGAHCPEGMNPRDEASVREEAGRCMSCGCRAGEACRLRRYAEDYHVPQVRAHPPAVVMSSPLIIRDHPDILFEPGKCIHCGLCARLAEAEGEPFGLTFLGRGRGARLAPPLGVSWADALTVSARACADICPTGALTVRGDPAVS